MPIIKDLNMVTKQPVEFSVDLTEERLNILCDKCLDTIADSIKDSSSDHDTAWTKGCLSFGRLHGLMIDLSSNKDIPWLTLVNNTMDFTVRIGRTLVQFVIDDAYNPKKTHRLNTNDLESMQFSLELERHKEVEVVIWRVFIGIDRQDHQVEPTATLVGFDLNHNPICYWNFDDNVITPVISEAINVVEIPEPKLVRKQNRDDLSNETK